MQRFPSTRVTKTNLSYPFGEALHITTSFNGRTGLSFLDDMDHEARSKLLMQLSLSFVVCLFIRDRKGSLTTWVTLAGILMKQSNAICTAEEF